MKYNLGSCLIAFTIKGESMFKNSKLRAIILALFIIILFAGIRNQLMHDGDVIIVEANPEAGFNYEYYLYIPKTIGSKGFKNMLVCPNNTGSTSDDHSVHVKRVEKHMKSSSGSYPKSISYALGVPMLMPTFDRPAEMGLTYTHALDSDTLKLNEGKLKRVDLQLIAMIKDAQFRLRDQQVKVKDKVIMDGYSASGNFTNRFVALHPEYIEAVSTGGVNSMPIIPLKSLNNEMLPFHVGIGDLKERTGDAFKMELYKKVDQYIYMGDLDNNDTLPYGDAYTEDERELTLRVLGSSMQERWKNSIEIYKQLEIPATMVTYEGVGHEITEEIMQDIIDFYKKVL